jgi:hypothetical protein
LSVISTFTVSVVVDFPAPVEAVMVTTPPT